MAVGGYHRLDRFIAANSKWSRRDVRLLLGQRRLWVNGAPATDINQLVGPFDRIELDGQLLQDLQPIYLALHKPAGIVSATSDAEHRTVLDLLRESLAVDQQPLSAVELQQLHIVGRLDKQSTGLLLLTNDSRWSASLMAPESKVSKVYLVTLENPVSQDYVAAFAAGMYFPFEDITTQPARLEILSEHQVRVTLTEGRYHQIKRMFGRFRNPVLRLHRIAIGDWQLDGLPEGQWRRIQP
ncbi:pseudouridine synthase [Oceanobacter mangrovi]|uniref:pseudouridine synthase n=1 Tax=Oceanobacter mangrovi TaxID=2862510 RepID=UPI001C8E5FD8|nr:16S rRNA pseudouridine(516) synthase [Oceanobacter mangrovi]